MSINGFPVTAGTAVTKSINQFNSSLRNLEITISGRSTGVVTIRVKAFKGDRLLAPSGASTIDLTTEQTLIVSGSAITEVQIDDTANVIQSVLGF